MKWTIDYFDEQIQEWINTLPVSIRAHYAKLTELLMEFGIDLRFPYSRPMGEGLFELRPKGKEGIARIFYCFLIGRRIVILHGFIKKTDETPTKELNIARKRIKRVKKDEKKNKKSN